MGYISKEELYQDIVGMSVNENIYKEYYMRNPYDAFALTESWEAFRKEYETVLRKNSPEDSFVLPEKPPTIIDKFLTEKVFFVNNNDIRIFRHARYIPAFIHTNEFIRILYVVSGGCDIYDANRLIARAEAGNICIMFPGFEHAVFSCHDDDVVVNIIVRRSTFESSFFLLLSEQSSISESFWTMIYNVGDSRMIFIKSDEDEYIQDIIIKIWHESHYHENPIRMMENSYICLLLGHIQRNHNKHIFLIGDNHIYSDRLPEILKYIIKNKKDITLSGLALHFNMSEGYMSRYIVNEISMTFKQFLRQVRMQHSAELLKNTNLSIEEIIETVGYTNQSRFYRNFKQRYGCTPKEYRQKL